MTPATWGDMPGDGGATCGDRGATCGDGVRRWTIENVTPPGDVCQNFSRDVRGPGR